MPHHWPVRKLSKPLKRLTRHWDKTRAKKRLRLKPMPLKPCTSSLGRPNGKRRLSQNRRVKNWRWLRNPQLGSRANPKPDNPKPDNPKPDNRCPVSHPQGNRLRGNLNRARLSPPIR